MFCAFLHHYSTRLNMPFFDIFINAIPWQFKLAEWDNSFFPLMQAGGEDG